VRSSRPVARRLGVALAAVLVVASAGRGEQLATKTYNIEAGLAHNRVKRIVQDSHGFLWFCTADGLSRFDGYQFTNYRVEDGLAGGSINDLLEAGEGVYWIATNSAGVVRFDLAGTRPGGADLRGRFTTYPISREPVTNRVNVLYRDSRAAIWAGTDGGLFRLDAAGSAFRPVNLGIPSRPDIQVQVWAFVEDAARNLWIGTRFGIVRRTPDGRMTHYDVHPAGDDDKVSALLFDRAGTLWIGHRSGLIAFQPDTGPPGGSADTIPRSSAAVARHYTTRDGLDSDDVIAVHQSRDGSMWIRTFGSGLSRLDDGTLRTYRVGPGAGDDVASVTEDRDGNLWMGTLTGGAVRITTHPWTTYGKADGLGESVSSVFEDAAGDLYAASSPWLVSRFDGTRFTTVRLPMPQTVSDESWRSITGIVQDHTGDWWIGTREGLYRFGSVDRFDLLARAHAKAVYTQRDGLASDDVTRVFEDPAGDIWIASWLPVRDVLVRWERATGTFRRYGDRDGLRPFTSAQAFASDAARNVWIGFREGGLARYRDGRFMLLGASEGLPEGSVNGLYLDAEHRLWAAVSGGGLGRIDHPEADRPRVVAGTHADGLTTSTLLRVTGDTAARIYAASIRGIDRLEPASGRVKHYSTADGLAGGEFTAAFRDHTGALWFATTTGLSRLVPEPEQGIAPPPILIGSVRIAGIAQPLSALGQTSLGRLELAAGQNNVQIEFFGMAFRSGEVLRYQYKLDGGGGDWSVPGPLRSVNYANLAPGSYQFAVRAVTTDGVSSPSPATVSFTILPPVWRRWWFIALMALAAAAASGLVARARYERIAAVREGENRLHRSREERLAELERVRKRIATDLHDDVGSSLTRISLLSEVVRQRVDPIDASLAEPLSSIGALARELVDSMSDIVWAINPTKDHLSDLSQRMRHFVSDVCTARHIDFRFDTPASPRDVTVGANVRREVFLLFKEAVTNMARHSGCTDAALEFREEQGGLLLRIADNGRGFDVAQASAGHGLRSMRERTEALAGQFSVASEPGRGTVVTFAIPLADRPQPVADRAAGTALHEYAVTEPQGRG
jgi:signal transduction histidine kinase/ligand-binding sensor domain-containing protein